MKILCDLPDGFELTDRHTTGRCALESRFGIDQGESRALSWMLKNGKIIHAPDDLKPMPEFGTKKALLLADVHSPYHDIRALDIAIEYGIKYNPDIVILMGDFADFYAISFWKNDPLRMPFYKEIEKTNDLLTVIDKAFDGKKKVYQEGNHEIRLRAELWSGSKNFAGLKALTVPGLLDLKQRGWQYVSNSELLENGIEPYKLGSLYVLHGHEIRVSTGAVNLPRIYYMKTHVNIAIGHHHQTQEFISRKLNHQHDGAWSIGGLCELSPTYAPSNNWNHGFATVEWDSDGDFSLENKKIIGGKVL